MCVAHATAEFTAQAQMDLTAPKHQTPQREAKISQTNTQDAHHQVSACRGPRQAAAADTADTACRTRLCTPSGRDGASSIGLGYAHWDSAPTGRGYARNAPDGPNDTNGPNAPNPPRAANVANAANARNARHQASARCGLRRAAATDPADATPRTRLCPERPRRPQRHQHNIPANHQLGAKKGVC